MWFCLCGCRGLCKQAGLLDQMSFRKVFVFLVCLALLYTLLRTYPHLYGNLRLLLYIHTVQKFPPQCVRSITATCTLAKVEVVLIHMMNPDFMISLHILQSQP